MSTSSPRRGRWIAFVAAVAVLLGVGGYALLQGRDDPTTGGPPPAGMPPITVEGDQILRDGEPWWLLGFNSFVWSDDCGLDYERMSTQQVDDWFASMRDDGRGAVRLFFFEGWDIERLDAAVESARRHNVYLTITLDDAIAGCGESTKDQAWFADQGNRDVYRDHMTMLLERYRGETAIAWFEYFNEPKYVDGAVREFYDEMGAVAESVDPDRLWASGTIAPFALDGEENFRELHESPYVDIASLHEYDFEEIESNHGPGTRANAAGKPVIVGEFGIDASNEVDCEYDFNARAEQFERKIEVYTGGDGYVGAMAWAWSPGRAGECRLENLADDQASQQVLREFGR